MNMILIFDEEEVSETGIVTAHVVSGVAQKRSLHIPVSNFHDLETKSRKEEKIVVA